MLEESNYLIFCSKKLPQTLNLLSVEILRKSDTLQRLEMQKNATIYP